jgi:uncharacterized protein YbjT (DUF2867 family)
MNAPQTVFIAGATGYIGQRLCARLMQRGHTVFALARPGSQAKLPAPCHAVIGDALNADSYAAQVPPGCVFVHLVGVAHPSPAKAQQFIDIDLASARASLSAAQHAAHFVYISVAQPAPVMAAYIRVRQEVEQLIQRSGLNASILRPWYVLGPGHRWPLLLLPLYGLAERLPGTRQTAQRLGLVSLAQMLNALTDVIEQALPGQHVYDVLKIRNGCCNNTAA